MATPLIPDRVDTSSNKSSDGNGFGDEKRAHIIAEAQQRPEEPQSHAITALFRKRIKHNPDDIATQPSVYDDPVTAEHFRPLATYENLHRFDPAERWTWREENRLVSRIDWKVTAWACIGFFALDLPRSNMNQANTDNFLDDLGLNTNDYNLADTVETITFLLAELPSQLISKKIGPDRWIPIQMIAWSCVSLSQFWLNGRASLLACRALIGLFQGGFIPDVILYLSYFFKGTELPLRLALFWMANRMTDVIAPLLAYGLLRLRGYHGKEGWRWLFLIEGILTLLIGIWSWFMMTPSPTQTKAWYRPKGWFTEREEKILVNRILRDDPAKGGMHNRQAISPKMFWKSLCDWHLWPIYALGLTFSIPGGPPGRYLTLSLRQLGFDTFQSNLLSIPAQVGTTVNMLILTWLSEVIDQRALLGLFTQFWFFPCVISLAVLPADINRWAMYALITVLLSYPTPHPMQVGWTSRQSNAVRTRTVSAALYNMCVQLSSIASANIYREDDRPEYRRGNRVLIGINCLNIVLYISVKVFYVWQNRVRERIWNAMSEEERNEYRENTKDEGSKRLDFRFAS
ncbi:major facilitator superfamily domain-containing protein [Plectosphaerella cucumerina]|uniref:Major facilitator superfamily domain-containing protein n=1 Tax=Plectosphaerella cucumerina TaxID=40658 RepID=A0A8K0TPQ7_9PEZI|nr:major facilitator superfamily domain-containing protein [Plectosphaerella cucumerina]